jgi:uncharacterized membrane protein YdjX (TVP38/TMEM64 family)
VTPRRRLALLALGIGAAAALVLLTVSRSPERVRDLVDGYGLLGPVVFVALAAVLACAFFPGTLLAGASGLLFGTAAGTPVSIAAATTGASLAFILSRHGAREGVEALAHPRLLRWREWVDRRCFVAVLYARVAPLMPFMGISYAAGLTRLRLGVFAAATAIGVAPRAFAYTALGGHLDDLSSPEALVAVGVLAGMALAGAALVFRRAGPERGWWSRAAPRVGPR